MLLKSNIEVLLYTFKKFYPICAIYILTIILSHADDNYDILL